MKLNYSAAKNSWKFWALALGSTMMVAAFAIGLNVNDFSIMAGALIYPLLVKYEFIRLGFYKFP